jgi:hypothetical protein
LHLKGEIICFKELEKNVKEEVKDKKGKENDRKTFKRKVKK